jgi:hypothetical protein
MSTETGESVSTLSKHGMTVAMLDLAGQTAPEPDWYRPLRFVCQECYQEHNGYCLGWPVAARKCPKTGVTQWVVRGRLASVGCAMRYATDRRHSFWQETSGLLALMLVRAYGMTDLLSSSLPIGTSRTELPPFSVELCKKWGRGEIQWDPQKYHASMMTLARGPDPTKHRIVSEHCAVLIDALVPRFKLGMTPSQLQAMFPGFMVKPSRLTQQKDVPMQVDGTTTGAEKKKSSIKKRVTIDDGVFGSRNG